MAQSLLTFASAALGAALMEVVYWREIYRKSNYEKYDRLIRSARYWVPACSFVIGTGLAAMIWFKNEASPDWRSVLAFGVSFPLVLKQLKQGLPGQMKLGKGDGGYFDV